MTSEILWSLFIGFLIAQTASLVTTVYLHRSSTHRSVEYHPAVEFVMQFLLWLTTGINRKEWVAVHLYHHAHADVEGDPHSPKLLGFWHVQLFNLFYYQKAAKKPEVLAYAKSINPTWAERTIFRFVFLGPVFGIIIACFGLGLKQGLIASAVHAVLYLFVLNNLINGWCHHRGYKNFPDVVAFNNRLIAFLTMGEGLHNNHHWKPTRPKLSVKEFEFDLGWMFIKILSAFKLARIERAINNEAGV